MFQFGANQHPAYPVISESGARDLVLHDARVRHERILFIIISNSSSSRIDVTIWKILVVENFISSWNCNPLRHLDEIWQAAGVSWLKNCVKFEYSELKHFFVMKGRMCFFSTFTTNAPTLWNFFFGYNKLTKQLAYYYLALHQKKLFAYVFGLCILATARPGHARSDILMESYIAFKREILCSIASTDGAHSHLLTLH